LHARDQGTNNHRHLKKKGKKQTKGNFPAKDFLEKKDRRKKVRRKKKNTEGDMEGKLWV